ncbi:MAG: hypothetical protein JSS43_20665 [Proteobacteria bacterium]|nr:hypothetical protein [Pseudomonadota bacterium]
MRRSLTDLLGYKLVFFRTGALHVTYDFKAGPGNVPIEEGEELYTNNVSGFGIITISAWALRSPVSLAATIVHELAHSAGAPGRPSDADWKAMPHEKRAKYLAAENALRVCGLHKQYNPEAYGEIQQRFVRALRLPTA